LKNSGKKKLEVHVPRVKLIGQKFTKAENKRNQKGESERNEFIITILVVNWVWFMERRLVAEEGSLSKKTWLQKINRSW